LAKRRLAGGDQPLNDSNLISKATLNVLEPSGRRGVTGVEEERLHLGHAHIRGAEEVVHLREFRGGEYIPRMNFNDGLRATQRRILNGAFFLSVGERLPQDLVDRRRSCGASTRGQNELLLFERLKNRVKRPQRCVRCFGQNGRLNFYELVAIHFDTERR
jgi:hypothetical protein